MRLRRFSQLGWLGCQDLAGFVMGSEVERVELGPPPVALAMCDRCEQMKPKAWVDSWQPHEVCEDCYWELPG